MAVSMRAVPALAVVLLASVFVVADDAKTKADSKQPAQAAGKEEAKSDGQARAVRLTKPWKDMASLSDEQKRQINQIHRKAVAEVKAVEQREKDEIMALLNDQQKAELTAMLEKDAAEKKAKAAQKPAKPSASSSQKNGGSDAAVAEKAESPKSAGGSN